MWFGFLPSVCFDCGFPIVCVMKSSVDLVLMFEVTGSANHWGSDTPRAKPINGCTVLNVILSPDNTNELATYICNSCSYTVITCISSFLVAQSSLFEIQLVTEEHLVTASCNQL